MKVCLGEEHVLRLWGSRWDTLWAIYVQSRVMISSADRGVEVWTINILIYTTNNLQHTLIKLTN